MVTYDVEGYRTAFNNYLQNPSQYPEPQWYQFVVPGGGGTPQGGSAAIPAPHVEGVTSGSDQLPPPSVQDPTKQTQKEKVQTIEDSKVVFNPNNAFGGEAGTYGNAKVEPVVAPAKVVTNVEPIVGKVEPLVGGGSIDERGQFGTTIIGQAVLPKETIQPKLISPAILPKIQPPTPQEIPVENKMQKVPLTDQQLKDIQTYTDNVTKTLTDAQASGAKGIQVFANGKQIDVFPVNANTKEMLFSALPDLQKNYGTITLGYTGATTETTKTQKIPLTQDQISQVHTYTENIVQTVQEAKASGAKNILVLDQSGKQVDSIPVGQDTTRILFSAVPNLQKEGKQITLSYTPAMKTVLPANYTPSYEEDVKTYGKDQVNLFTEVVKGSNEGINDLLNQGKAAAAYIWSGGKVPYNPSVKGDVISNTITSPIKTTVDSSGKTTTSVSAENAKQGLIQVQTDIEKNPARQVGRLLPSIETIIGTGLASEGIGTLAKGGSTALKVVTTPKGDEPFSGSFVRQYPTYRATNMMRTKLPSDIFSSDNAQPSSFISKNVDLGSGAVKTGGNDFSDTGISLGRGTGGAPPTSTPKDFINAIKDLPTRPNKNAQLPSYEFKPTDTEGGNVVNSGKQSLIQKTETKPQETVAKTIQKQLEENQKKVENLYGQKSETTTKTTTKADQAMKDYNDTLATRKAKMRDLIASEESYIFVKPTKVITVPKQEQIFSVDNIFEPLQKQTTDIITIPKQKQTQIIDVIEIPKQKTTPIFDIPQEQIQIHDTPQKQVTEQIFDIPSGGKLIEIPTTTTKQTTIPDIPTPQFTPLDIPVPNETTIPDILGGGNPFTPSGGSTGSGDNPHGSKKRLFVDYDVSEDPLGISKLGYAEYSPFGNKPTTTKITQVKTKTPTSKSPRLPKYSLKGMFKLPKQKKNKK